MIQRQCLSNVSIKLALCLGSVGNVAIVQQLNGRRPCGSLPKTKIENDLTWIMMSYA